MLFYLIYIAAIVGLLTAIILSFRNTSTTKVTHKPVVTTPTIKPKNVTKKPNPSTPQVSSTPNTSLSNSGPGDIVGLFVVITLTSASIHWLVRRHKLYLN
ncbi:MAG TPA: hypothetical protein VLF63_02000 [Patescibacteria group bacterium]|nr:hypothetical protein [Patescibacteria group bacterium]